MLLKTIIFQQKCHFCYQNDNYEKYFEVRFLWFQSIKHILKVNYSNTRKSYKLCSN